MPRNLIELIRASGRGGGAGQSFNNDVLPVPPANKTDTRMTDYLITGYAFEGTFPVPDLATPYADNTLFNPVARLTRGVRAGFIQRDELAAWTFTVLEGAAVSQTARVEIDGFVPDNTNGTHTFNLRVRGVTNANPVMNTPVTQSVPSGGANYTPWPVTFTASVSGLGSSGSSLLTISHYYDPDIASFNEVIFGQAWQGYFANRILNQDTDFDYQWRSVSGSVISTSRTFTLSYDLWGIYPTNPNGLLEQELSNPIELFWKRKTEAAYTAYTGQVIRHQDPRNAI